MPVPTMEPQVFELAGLPAAARYQPGQRVWVYRTGAWRPGIVLHRSTQAVMVRYRPGNGSGTGVDTVTGSSLADRVEPDPYLDGPPETLTVH
jgi:hypothetical protein